MLEPLKVGACPLVPVAGTAARAATPGSDRFASLEVYEETASPIPDSTLTVYEGKGHRFTIPDERLAADVLDFARRARSTHP